MRIRTFSRTGSAGRDAVVVRMPIGFDEIHDDAHHGVPDLEKVKRVRA